MPPVACSRLCSRDSAQGKEKEARNKSIKKRILKLKLSRLNKNVSIISEAIRSSMVDVK